MSGDADNRCVVYTLGVTKVRSRFSGTHRCASGHAIDRVRLGTEAETVERGAPAVDMWIDVWTHERDARHEFKIGQMYRVTIEEIDLP